MSVKSQFKVTHQQADGAAFLPYERVFTAKVADKDAAHNVSFAIEAGELILAVVARCVVTVNGAVPIVLVGDGVDPDGFFPAAAALETAGDLANSLGATGAFAAGKYFASTGRFVVNFNADAAAGEIELHVLFSGK